MGLGIRTRLQRAAAWRRERAFRIRRWLIRARLDFGDWRRGERDPLLPPRRKNLPSQFTAVGGQLASDLREHAGLSRSSAVLDVGCGPGRVAAPLTRFLDPASGTYEGFDVMPESIAWCRKAITPKHPNFHFQVADLHNAQYNPAGSQRADEYTFPYADDSFDVALAASLFTHLRPFEGQRYLDEISRVLRPGGHLLGTWFLINEEAEDLLAGGRARQRALQPPVQLRHSFTDERGNPFRSPHLETPEHLIAIDQSLVAAQYDRAGLEIVAILPGGWPGREEPPSRMNQDTVVAVQPAR